jgi:gamma-glutamylcyclotransferase (GGCT)/AIG2-like uncharacterized protein YtfP
VYGTLRKGGGRAYDHILGGQKGVKFLAEAETQSHWKLLDCGWYPAVIPHVGEGAVKVKVDIFEVPDRILTRMDMYESFPQLYIRSLFKVGKYEDVWMYYSSLEKMGGEHAVREVINGDWLSPEYLPEGKGDFNEPIPF